MGDRNFCTTEFILRIKSKQAFFLVRQHQNLPWQETSALVESGKTEGGVVFEQRGVVSYEGQELHCRRVVVQLDRPTRDGESEIALLTNLPETDAPSVLIDLTQFSSLLQDWANSVNLKAFTSSPRKPKKKKPKPPYDPRHPHVSTARLLAEKNKSRGSPPK